MMKLKMIVAAFSIFILSSCLNLEENNRKMKVEVKTENTQNVTEEEYFYAKKNIYRSKKFDLEFEHQADLIQEKENEIFGYLLTSERYADLCKNGDSLCSSDFIDGNYYDEQTGKIIVFEKDENVDIKDAIKKLVAEKGKFFDANCKFSVVESEDDNFRLLVESLIPLSDDEIYERNPTRIRNACSDFVFAGFGGVEMGCVNCFAYSPKNEGKFVFLDHTGGIDADFFEPESVKFIND